MIINQTFSALDVYLHNFSSACLLVQMGTYAEVKSIVGVNEASVVW